MTNQSHTELAARLREIACQWTISGRDADTLRQGAAALESPERVHGVDSIRRLVADDAFAMSFQTMGQYRSAILKACPTTPSPQAEKQPLSLDEIQAWAVRRMSALGPEGVTDPVAFLEEGVRWGEAQHGIVTKEST